MVTPPEAEQEEQNPEETWWAGPWLWLQDQPLWQRVLVWFRGVMEDEFEPIADRPDFSSPSPYPKYSCGAKNPLACPQTAEPWAEGDTQGHCGQCGFPKLLPLETKIRGQGGEALVLDYLGTRGRSRLYGGVTLPDRQPLVLQEFLWPQRYFSPQDIRLGKEMLGKLGGLALADGRVLDFRLLVPDEAIADPRLERAYLIYRGDRGRSPTLAQVVADRGPLPARRVRQLVNQGLQTLAFLHGQKFLLPSGMGQVGMAHGDLSLETMLYQEPVQPEGEGVFDLVDLASWTLIFDPFRELGESNPQKDLRQLGHLAHGAWQGGMGDPQTGQPWDPLVPVHWSKEDPPLRAFLLDLMGLGLKSFPDAESARRELLGFCPELVQGYAPVKAVAFADLPEETLKPQPWWRNPKVWVLLAILGLGGNWLYQRWLNRNDMAVVRTVNTVCCTDQVPTVTTGAIAYQIPAASLGDYLFNTPNLLAPGETLDRRLRQTAPLLKTWQQLPGGESWLALRDRLQAGQIDFAVGTQVEGLPEDLTYEEIAYDGLAVFVPFSQPQSHASLPPALGGKLTLPQIQDLFTGKITNWQQVGGPDLPVQVYIPADPQIVHTFEQQILQTPDNIEQFRQWQRSRNLPPGTRPIVQLSTFPLLRRAIADFEQNQPVGAIGFDSLSKIFGQCAVYPLAIAADDKQPAIAPLETHQGAPLNPKNDLCNTKGNYRPAYRAIRQGHYPWRYSLAVVHLRDNRRIPAALYFADLWRTTQGQILLRQVGLTPLYDDLVPEPPAEPAPETKEAK